MITKRLNQRRKNNVITQITFAVVLVFFLFSNCSNLKKIHSFKSDKIGLKIFLDKTEEDTLIFELKNKSTEVIQYPNTFYVQTNMLEFHSPIGIVYQSHDHSGPLYPLKSKKSVKIDYKHIDLFLLHGHKAKETGNYTCIWKNERLDFYTEFMYYFDYEKAKKKYGLEDY